MASPDCLFGEKSTKYPYQMQAPVRTHGRQYEKIRRYETELQIQSGNMVLVDFDRRIPSREVDGHEQVRA